MRGRALLSGRQGLPDLRHVLAYLGDLSATVFLEGFESGDLWGHWSCRMGTDYCDCGRRDARPDVSAFPARLETFALPARWQTSGTVSALQPADNIPS